jgi:hypothetical protein
MSTLGNAGTTNSGSQRALVFVSFTGISASAVLIHGLSTIHGWHSCEFLSLLVVAALTSRLKIKLPGLNGNMSVSLPFILIAMTKLSLPEALAVAASSILIQSVPRRPHKFRPVQVLFNVSTGLVATELGWQMFHRVSVLNFNPTLSLLSGCVAYFFASTIPVAMIISLSENRKALGTWSGIVHLSFPYYVASTGLASIAVAIGGNASWPMLVGMSLVMFVTYRSYRVYFGLIGTSAAVSLTAQSMKAKSANTAS